MLYTIINEYDVLYAQERELADHIKNVPQGVLSTNPDDFTDRTRLPEVWHTTDKSKRRYFPYDYF